ncbi:hypothetical protein TIFTF001_016289 [Ficus carica]|uniref:Uncharacterized protein n=1 Tax=Ficus carica TaxID=3494 RepID=A0AA88D7A8_FICCA|nr:hypothetical protein TIFTF001_016289 [Ficus carica]
MGGGMEANKNKFIEDWGAARETLEHNFRWTRRNLVLVGLFGIAIPIFVYRGIVKEFHMQDEDAGTVLSEMGAPQLCRLYRLWMAMSSKSTSELLWKQQKQGIDDDDESTVS